MKTKADKRINQKVRKMNKQLKEDVFGTRFWARQYRKTRSKETNTWYYMYELCDRKQPERNKLIGWYSEFELTTFHPIDIEMNDFIVNSSFWKEYKEVSL